MQQIVITSTLFKQVKQLRFDLIVMGPYENDTISNLFGSVAIKVVPLVRLQFTLIK